MASSLSNSKRINSIDPLKLFQSQDFADTNKPFRENIRSFIENFAEIQDYTVNGMPVWCTFVVTESDGVLALYTLEETVRDTSLAISFCDHCKTSGWGHHYVCKRKYHFIIPENENWKEPLKGHFAQIRSHYLYGLIHSNGYGHLVCVNGSVDNSNLVNATGAMEFWNNLCTVLKARKISVQDDLTKGSVELRLIYGVACGESLFGKWGYKFSCEGSGITEQKFEWAIQFISSLSLDRIVADYKKRRNGNKIKNVINKYRELSEKPLATIRDLLQFMLAYESRNRAHDYNGYTAVSQPKETPIGFHTFIDLMAKNDCRWSARRLEVVLTAIVNSLKDHKEINPGSSRGMTRNELREETRKSIGDTGLIDFVLKSIRCFEVENLIIRRVINPNGRPVAFTIYEVAKKAELRKWPVLNYDGRWSQDKLENAIEVMMSILMENRGNNAITQPELRDRARECISDIGLIDFVLKSLDNSKIGNQMVYRTKNPITKRVEFAVAEHVDVLHGMDNLYGLNLNQDVLFIYENVLLRYPESSSVSLATRVILESKQFIKDWPIEKKIVNDLMTVTCQVLPSFEELETEFTRRLSPGEEVVVPCWITVGELKLMVQCALRDAYYVMDEFVVTQIGGLKAVDDDVVLSSILEPGGHIWVRGSGLDLVTRLRHEDGAQTPCKLGTRGDLSLSSYLRYI